MIRLVWILLNVAIAHCRQPCQSRLRYHTLRHMSVTQASFLAFDSENNIFSETVCARACYALDNCRAALYDLDLRVCHFAEEPVPCSMGESSDGSSFFRRGYLMIHCIECGDIKQSLTNIIHSEELDDTEPVISFPDTTNSNEPNTILQLRTTSGETTRYILMGTPTPTAGARFGSTKFWHPVEFSPSSSAISTSTITLPTTTTQRKTTATPITTTSTTTTTTPSTTPSTTTTTPSTTTTTPSTTRTTPSTTTTTPTTTTASTTTTLATTTTTPARVASRIRLARPLSTQSPPSSAVFHAAVDEPITSFLTSLLNNRTEPHQRVTEQRRFFGVALPPRPPSVENFEEDLDPVGVEDDPSAEEVLSMYSDFVEHHLLPAIDGSIQRKLEDHGLVNRLAFSTDWSINRRLKSIQITTLVSVAPEDLFFDNNELNDEDAVAKLVESSGIDSSTEEELRENEISVRLPQNSPTDDPTPIRWSHAAVPSKYRMFADDNMTADHSSIVGPAHFRFLASNISLAQSNSHCPQALLLPCSVGVGKHCRISEDASGCLLCLCPKRSVARGCFGSIFLTEFMRTSLIHGRQRCRANGRIAQVVTRWFRKIDPRTGTDECVSIQHPYCGAADERKHRLPRTEKECQTHCYETNDNLLMYRQHHH